MRSQAVVNFDQFAIFQRRAVEHTLHRLLLERVVKLLSSHAQWKLALELVVVGRWKIPIVFVRLKVQPVIQLQGLVHLVLEAVDTADGCFQAAGAPFGRSAFQVFLPQTPALFALFHAVAGFVQHRPDALEMRAAETAVGLRKGDLLFLHLSVPPLPSPQHSSIRCQPSGSESHCFAKAWSSS